MHQETHAELLYKNIVFNSQAVYNKITKQKICLKMGLNLCLRKAQSRAGDYFSPELSGSLCNCSLSCPSSPIHPFSMAGSLKYWKYAISSVQSYVCIFHFFLS